MSIALDTGNLFISEYKRSRYSSVERLAAIALLAYAFFWLSLFDVSQVAESLLLLLFVVVLVTRESGLRREPLLYLFYAWVFYQLLYIPSVINEYPDLAKAQIEYALHYSKFALILVVGWWLGGSVRNVVLLLFLAAIGFLLGVTFQPDGVLDRYQDLLAFQRLGLGYKNWEHVSVYAAFTLLTFLGLRRQILVLFGPRRWLGWLVIGAGALYSFAIVVVTQTRATWLGLLVAVIVVLPTFYILRRRRAAAGHVAGEDHRPALKKYVIILAMVMLVAVLLTATGAHKMIGERLNHERDVVSVIVSGDTTDIPLSSIGIRIVMWSQALEWFAERPLTGWGPKTRDALFENGELPAAIPGHGIHHFHNQTLELAVAYGLIGLAVFGLVLLLTVRTALRGWHAGRIPDDVLLYGIAFLAYWFVVNLFESYFNYSTGSYLNALVGGAFYTFRFTENRT